MEMQQLGLFRIELRISRPNHLEFLLLSENRLFKDLLVKIYNP
jgi:hypothetical protein